MSVHNTTRHCQQDLFCSLGLLIRSIGVPQGLVFGPLFFLTKKIVQAGKQVGQTIVQGPLQVCNDALRNHCLLK